MSIWRLNYCQDLSLAWCQIFIKLSQESFGPYICIHSIANIINVYIWTWFISIIILLSPFPPYLSHKTLPMAKIQKGKNKTKLLGACTLWKKGPCLLYLLLWTAWCQIAKYNLQMPQMELFSFSPLLVLLLTILAYLQLWIRNRHLCWISKMCTHNSTDKWWSVKEKNPNPPQIQKALIC